MEFNTEFGSVAPKKKAHLLKTGKWIENWSEKWHFKERTDNMEQLWDENAIFHCATLNSSFLESPKWFRGCDLSSLRVTLFT